MHPPTIIESFRARGPAAVDRRLPTGGDGSSIMEYPRDLLGHCEGVFGAFQAEVILKPICDFLLAATLDESTFAVHPVIAILRDLVAQDLH